MGQLIPLSDAIEVSLVPEVEQAPLENFGEVPGGATPNGGFSLMKFSNGGTNTGGGGPASESIAPGAASSGGGGGNSPNRAPIGVVDNVTVDEDSSISINVLRNDRDPDGDSLQIIEVSDPENGTIEVNGGVIVYTPNPDFHGDDSFTYTISDGNGGIDTVSVNVQVAMVVDGNINGNDPSNPEIAEGNRAFRYYCYCGRDI